MYIKYIYIYICIIYIYIQREKSLYIVIYKESVYIYSKRQRVFPCYLVPVKFFEPQKEASLEQNKENH